MAAFVSWYLIVSLLGWLAFPLVHRLFPALADRGYAMSRAVGLLIWGYLFWLLASLGIAQNDIGGILLALVLLLAISAWSFFTPRSQIANRESNIELPRSEIAGFLRSRLPLIIATEVVFLVAFAFMAFVRSANPELTTTEKPMELAFISAIMRSPTFPPQDPWLSGYAISYYYFGYVLTAMLGKLSGVPGSLAHNLMTSLIFALGALGAYSILYNLLHQAAFANRSAIILHRISKIATPLLAPLFLLLVSNFGAPLEILHQLGVFWVKDPSTGQYASRFWTWLDMKELSQVPAQPFHPPPLDRFLWWWRSSRVLQDYDMLHNPLEVIDEFPFFSFLLGDLHPHVLAIPVGLLAIAVAWNIFLGGWRGETKLLGARLNLEPGGFLFSALVLGGLAFLNTWDILIGAALIAAAYVFSQANEHGWSWRRFDDLFLLGLPLGLASILLYLPFYFGFSSQAGGLLPSLMYPSRGAHLWVMWGTLLIPVYACLLYLWFEKRLPPNWGLGASLGLGFIAFLFLLAWGLAGVMYLADRDFVLAFLSSQAMDLPTFFRETSLRRLSYIGGLVMQLAVLVPSLAFLFSKAGPSFGAEDHSGIAPRTSTIDHRTSNVENRSSVAENRNASIPFVLLLMAFGAVLVIAPDFLYLKDQFGYRINTVFKFYYQAWILWSLAAAFGTAYLLQQLRGWRDALFRTLIGLAILSGLLYPSLGLVTKTNSFKPYGGYTLDDLDRVRRENPDEAAAIEWLRRAPNGVVVEAVGGSYTGFARISAYTGLQTVLGWPGHEAQWRGSAAPQGTRQADVEKLYTTVRWEEAALILEKYDVRYVYIGNLERASHPVNEEKFASHLRPVFRQGGVVVYEVP